MFLFLFFIFLFYFFSNNNSQLEKEVVLVYTLGLLLLAETRLELHLALFDEIGELLLDLVGLAPKLLALVLDHLRVEIRKRAVSPSFVFSFFI